ncbi:MAG: ATP-binding protein, partial [Nitriliruptorales bacterium]
MRPALRLSYHRGTTAHISSLYPFSVQPPFGARGPYIGVDLLAGGAPFCWDPFEAYATGAVTNPNVWVLGEPGGGKSALIKCLLARMATIYGHGPDGRWVAIADPKGEYLPLAEHLGLTVLR